MFLNWTPVYLFILGLKPSAPTVINICWLFFPLFIIKSLTSQYLMEFNIYILL